MSKKKKEQLVKNLDDEIIFVDYKDNLIPEDKLKQMIEYKNIINKQMRIELGKRKSSEPPAKKYSDKDFDLMTKLAIERNVNKAAEEVVKRKKEENPYLPYSLEGLKKMWRESTSYIKYQKEKKNRN